MYYTPFPNNNSYKRFSGFPGSKTVIEHGIQIFHLFPTIHALCLSVLLLCQFAASNISKMFLSSVNYFQHCQQQGEKYGYIVFIVTQILRLTFLGIASTETLRLLGLELEGSGTCYRQKSNVQQTVDIRGQVIVSENSHIWS